MLLPKKQIKNEKQFKYIKKKGKKFKPIKISIIRSKIKAHNFNREYELSPLFFLIIKIFLIFLLLYILITIIKIIKSQKTFFCFCAIARNENLYAREIVSYYLSIGAGKFILGDNNLNNTEKLSDVLSDYISNGTVEIIDLIGQNVFQAEFYGFVYEKYKNKCNWISFFDFDEYLIMHFEKGKNITVKEFLSNKIFSDCESIEINWVLVDDNNLVYYDPRPTIVRFTHPIYKTFSNIFVKSIVRGGLNKTTFTKSEHIPDKHLLICNSDGKKITRYDPYTIGSPVYKNAELWHYTTRTAEEFLKKIKRGFLGTQKKYLKSLKDFFSRNKFTKEKLYIFEKGLNMTFPKFHESKYKLD